MTMRQVAQELGLGERELARLLPEGSEAERVEALELMESDDELG